MDAIYPTAALAALEKTINTALRYDPGTRIALAQLADQVLAINVTAPDFTFYITPDAQGIRLMGHWQGEVQTRLRGSAIALTKLARSERASFADSGVEVIGSTGLLVDLQRLLKNLDIDWEEALSDVFGDLLGHQGAAAIRSGIGYTRERASEAKRLLSEFVTEELGTLPSRNELEGFYSAVDEVRMQADRVAARVQQLMQKAKSP